MCSAKTNTKVPVYLNNQGSALQKQKAVAAHLTSEQLLSFGFAQHGCSPIS